MARVNQSNAQEKSDRKARKLAKELSEGAKKMSRRATGRAQLGTLPGEGTPYTSSGSWPNIKARLSDPQSRGRKTKRTFGGEHTGKKRHARKKAK